MSSTVLIRDSWVLARPKVKYYGAYPSGFLERARILLVGGCLDACIWHVCGGRAKDYNGTHGGIKLTGFGKNDRTIDLDPSLKPDLCCDVREIIPRSRSMRAMWAPDGILIDRPYTEGDADHYWPGRDALPDIHKLTRDCLSLTKGHVGVIDYVCPNPGKAGKMVASVGITMGSGNKARGFWVFRS